MAKEYALYKGEEILSIGTIPEISKETGISEKTVRFYGTPSHKKRSNDLNRNWLVYIDYEEDDE